MTVCRMAAESAYFIEQKTSLVTELLSSQSALLA